MSPDAASHDRREEVADERERRPDEREAGLDELAEKLRVPAVSRQERSLQADADRTSAGSAPGAAPSGI